MVYRNFYFMRGLQHGNRNKLRYLFISGLNLFGWDNTFINIVFLSFSLSWILLFHWTVLKEEAFLHEKYGMPYNDFKRSIPRYIGLPEKQNI